MKPNIHIIGGTEKISFPRLNAIEVLAKVDTGADISSIWCSHVKKIDGGIECIFFGPESSHYTGEKFIFKKGEYKVSRVYNSFGHDQKRYKVKIPVVISGRRVLGTFTLSDRSQKSYSVLIGRKLLARKFLVDVAIAGHKIKNRLKTTRKAVNV